MKSRIDMSFSKVRRLKKEQCADDWLSDTALGDIILLSSTWGRGPGLIKVTKCGCFLSLTSDQVWDSKPIDWPDKSSGIRSLRLVGDSVEIS